MSDDQLQSEDVFIQILVKLSVRSLMRFRCISKSWCALIKSSTFHLLRNQKYDNVLLVRRYLPPPEDEDVFSFYNLNSLEVKQVLPNLSIPLLKDLRFKYDHPYCPEAAYLLGPDSGLLCIACIGNYYLCNPALREFKQLPPCPFVCPKGFSTEIFAEGFGCTCTNDFKIVLIRRVTLYDDYDPDLYIMVHLYTSNTNLWRTFAGDIISVKNLCNYACSELLFNGVCHWNANSTGFSSPDTILTFNIGTEVFGQLEFIPDWEEEVYGYCVSLIAIDNCLGMIRYEGWLEEPQLIDIWVMNEYGVGESWTKSFVIGPYEVICPFMFWNNDGWLLVESTEGQLVACALHTNEARRLQICGVERTLRSVIYKESLISLNQVRAQFFFQIKISYKL
uniref:S locus F-box (SLF)-S4A protein n=1 Tax=Antirrhinum hispanicum TaxID=49039 RepID=Q70WR4_ANTHI|nr:S locus F-box (SLF)-S4A protein [Antirrhinum hispanicum]